MPLLSFCGYLDVLYTRCLEVLVVGRLDALPHVFLLGRLDAHLGDLFHGCFDDFLYALPDGHLLG